MRKFALLTVALLLLAPMLAITQQTVERYDFSHMRGWRVGHGDWSIQNGRLVQADTQTPLARIDHMVRQQGEYQIDFEIRYRDGGYADEMAFENRRFHAGFGVHVAVSNPALGRRAWGSGESYLLWLNLDTRPETQRNYPQHYGFRAQVYESNSNVDMDLYRSAQVRRLLGNEVLSVDIMQALENYGIDVSLTDMARYLQRDVPVSIRVNTNTGRIGVKDPTAPLWFYFNVDPDLLDGGYVSLRTNKLSAAFDNFQVTQR